MKKILAIGIVLCIAIAIPTSAQAGGGFVVQPTPAKTPSAQAGGGGGAAVQPASPLVIRVNFVDFKYEMPSGRTPGPLSDQWYITGTVTNEEGKIISEERSGIFYIGEAGHWVDLEIWKDIPKEGDTVSITLGARTYALGYYIDINPEEVFLRTPHDPTGRRHTTDYVIGTEQEGWGIGGTGLFSVISDLNGNLHYKIETIGLPAPEEEGNAKGCIQYPAYPPCTSAQCTIPEDMVAVGIDLDLACEVRNCGDTGGNIEARILNANTGKTLAANWSYCDAGDENCTVIAHTILKTTIEDVHHPIVLGYQARHWDSEHAKWITDDGRFERIIVAPIPMPISTPTPPQSLPELEPPDLSTPPPISTPTSTPGLAPVPPVATTPAPIAVPAVTSTPMAAPASTSTQQSLTEIFTGWLNWLGDLFSG